MLAASAVIRDERGYVCTGRDVMDLVASRHGTWPLARDPHLLETSVPGIFAAGDVRHGSIGRVAAGVGEGSMAIAFIHRYLLPSARPEKVAAQQDAATIEAALLVALIDPLRGLGAHRALPRVRPGRSRRTRAS